MSLCLYHQSLPITRVIVCTTSPEIKIKEKEEEKINSSQIREIKFPEIKFSIVHEYKLQEYINRNYRKKRNYK